jgi:hypothetical protein
MKERWLIALLALVSASLFALSVQAGHWWTVETFELGPLRSGFADARGERFGIATWAAGMIAMLALIIVAAAVAAKRTPRMLAKMALVAVATALVVGAGFVMLRPDMPDVHVARGLYMFAGAVVTGAVAALLVLRRR